MSDYPAYASPGAPESPPPPPEEPKARNTIGLVALITAIVGFVFAILPGAALLGWILLPIAFILSIVGLAQSGRPKGGAVAALIVSIVGTIAGVIAFFLMVGSVIDDVLTPESPDITISEPAGDDADNGAQGGGDAADPGAGELGSRDNPVPLGTVISNNEWDLTILSFTPDATAEVVSSSRINREPEEGMAYALVEAEVTYKGSDSADPIFDVRFAFVSEGGHTYRASDTFVSAPDPSFSSIGELYPGASGKGFEAIALPAEEEGLLRVRLGLFGADLFVATR